MEQSSAPQTVPPLTGNAPETRLLPAPPAGRRGRAAIALADRWNRLRNDLRLTVEDHLVAAPLIALAGGLLAGCILRAAFLRSPKY